MVSTICTSRHGSGRFSDSQIIYLLDLYISVAVTKGVV